jgi:3-hydroxybutyryl-CoA dehydrogenase
MGAGIAQVAASYGHPVLITDAQPAAIERGLAGIARALQREVDKGRMSAEDAQTIRARVRVIDSSGGYAGLSGCDMVIEAVVERLEVKQEVFRTLEDSVTDTCILATNTSSLSIASIAASCEHPERVLGVHFFNPATMMPLVEIVPGLRSDPAVVATARGVVDSWGKTTVVAADTPGFIVNRIARPYYGEALRQLEEGIADTATIDWAMKELGGFRMGPFELMDLIGHDVNYVVTETVWTAMYYDPRYRPSVAQKRLLEAGLLGRKSGRGFFDYSDDATRPAPAQDREAGQAIVRRILAMLVNEAVDAVHLKVASPADIELAMTRGVNYPRGLLAWGNQVGPANILGELDRLQAETGDDRYRPSPLLRRCVREGRELPA